MVPGSEIIKSCANLVRNDSDTEDVSLIHHSTLLFLRQRFAQSDDDRLFESPENFPDSQDRPIPLGELCVLHLTSSDFARALQPMQAASHNQNINVSAITENSELPLWVRWRLRNTSSPNASVVLPTRASSSPATTFHSFFNFAREQWTFLTTEFDLRSPIWAKFEVLSWCPNRSWKLHPWPADATQKSHILGLLGWSIVEEHMPLTQVVLRLSKNLNFTPRPWENPDNLTLLDCPIPQYGNLLPLHLAAMKGNTRTMGLLLRNFPDKFETNEKTALHYAAQNGSSEMIRYLYKKGSGPLVSRDNSGRTPLGIAASEGNEDTVSALLDLGADWLVKDNDSLTPKDIALRNGHHTIAQLLQNHDVNSMRSLLQATQLYYAENHSQPREADTGLHPPHFSEPRDGG